MHSFSRPTPLKDTLHANVGALGLLYAMFAVGYVLAAVWLGRAARIGRRGPLAYGGLILSGLMMLAFGLPLPLAGLALVAICNGAALEVFGLIWANTLQERVPRDMLGRVASIDLLGSFALLPVGYAIAGWATALLGAAAVCAIRGLLTVAFAALGLAHPAIRAFD